MSVRSKNNNRLAPLAGNGKPLDTFTGIAESTLGGNVINVAISTDTLSTVLIEQSSDKGKWWLSQSHQVQPNTQSVFQMQCSLDFFRVTVHNDSDTQQTYCYMVTSLVQIIDIASVLQNIFSREVVSNKTGGKFKKFRNTQKKYIRKGKKYIRKGKKTIKK